MFSWFTKKTKEDKNTEGKEYSFIWYKRMKNKDKVIYTQPFRTKVRAKSHEEAKEKVIQFALSKMELIVVDEAGYDKTDLSILQKGFEEMHRRMENLMKKFDT